jgi:cytidylate kinase
LKEQQKWRFISREILSKSAEELNLDPEALKLVISDKNRGMMDEIVEALSSHSHKSDHKILETIREVISQFGTTGNVVILGRGGASFCKDINRSLHIRLEAPEDWRINSISQRLDFSKAFATKYVRETDAERELLLTKYFDRKPDNSTYDVHLNSSRFTEKEIVDIIIQIAAIKGLF